MTADEGVEDRELLALFGSHFELELGQLVVDLGGDDRLLLLGGWVSDVDGSDGAGAALQVEGTAP